MHEGVIEGWGGLTTVGVNGHISDGVEKVVANPDSGPAGIKNI